MPKRFTSTEKWSDPWFQDLEGKYKLFWFYICDNCDCAGIWKVNMRLAQFQIGVPMEASEVLRVLKDRVKQISEEYWYIIKFVHFQYGVLSKDCKPHIPVINRLKYYGITERVIKGVSKGIDTLEDMDKEKEMEKEKETEKETVEDLVFPSPLVREAWATWTEFKRDQFKFKYKSPKSEQAGINELVELCFGNYDHAALIVNQSIAKGWKGLFELKNKPRAAVKDNATLAREMAERQRKAKGIIETEGQSDGK